LTDFASLTGKHCDLALDLVPGAHGIGVLIFVDSSDAAAARKAVNDAASAYKFTPKLIDVREPADIASGFRALADARVEVAIVGSGGVFASDRGRTAAGAAAVKMPAIYNEQGYVEAGGLISYGFNRKAAMVRTADFAVRILEGAKPSDLPVEQTENFFMAINRTTAASLGLTFAPTILSRVDQMV
jgi:putative ABC transport system substrate-binding protein